MSKKTVLELDKFKNIPYSGYACFDMDHTIIKPNNGRVFPKNKDDWVIMDNVYNVKEIVEFIVCDNLKDFVGML